MTQGRENFLTARTKLDRHICVPVDADMLRVLQKISKAKNRSVASVVRGVLSKILLNKEVN